MAVSLSDCKILVGKAHDLGTHQDVVENVFGFIRFSGLSVTWKPITPKPGFPEVLPKIVFPRTVSDLEFELHFFFDFTF